jgi:glycosyltransferase involved in cell wall biosynthesis
MSSDPRVSIIIPVHNSGQYITASVESALAQTWANCELIIVDDHSADESWKIAMQFRSDSVQVLKNRGRGAAAARNTGMSHASGEFLQFLDADDLLSPEKIANQLEHLRAYPNRNLASCAWGRFRDAPAAAQFFPETVWRDYPEPSGWLLDSWEIGGMMQTACWLVPRVLTEDAGPWNQTVSVNDDGEYFSRVILKSSGIAFCPYEGVLYRSSLAGSLSRRADDQSVGSAFTVCELYESHIKDAGLSDLFEHALALNYLRFIYQYHPARMDLVRKAWLNATRLGVTIAPNVGGAKFQWLSRRLGFMNALRLRSFASGFRLAHLSRSRLDDN